MAEGNSKSTPIDLSKSIEEFEAAIKSAQETIEYVNSGQIANSDRERIAIRSEVDKFRASCWKITDALINR